MKSVFQHRDKSETLPQSQNRRGSADIDCMSNSNLESAINAEVCQTHSRGLSPPHQPSEDGKGHDLSVTHDYSTGETERKLREKLIELEKEVNLYLKILLKV